MKSESNLRNLGFGSQWNTTELMLLTYETMVSSIRKESIMSTYLLLLKGFIKHATAILIPVTPVKMPW